MHMNSVMVLFIVVLLQSHTLVAQLVGNIDDSAAEVKLCPKFCRFYQLHWAGECNGIFHEATCPATCGETLQEIYDHRKLSHYVLDDWSSNSAWAPLVRGINKRLEVRGGKPDLGVAATCELYGENNYMCKSTELPEPVTQWARDALAVASNGTRKTTSPDLRMFCICGVKCTTGIRVTRQIAKDNLTVCECPRQFVIQHDEPMSLGYNEIYNSTR